MTYQEANALVDDFSFVYKGNSISKEMLIECREVIHKVLEKQIPKKLLIDNRNIHYVNYKDFICPCCKNCIASIIDGDFFGGRKQKHCDECGQALDWSVLKEWETKRCMKEKKKLLIK